MGANGMSEFENFYFLKIFQHSSTPASTLFDCRKATQGPQHSRGSRIPQIGRNVQENRKRRNEPASLTPEELAMWAKMTDEEKEKWVNEQKQREEAQEKAKQKRKQQEKARHNKIRRQYKEFCAEATKNEEQQVNNIKNI
ncbi:MAG: hypothetical protein LBJ13_00715 [Puniceicoccales bacterium]|jgi:hypothetical protein|nr:hypothetical protein [Puniceicoccales bacterium]